MPACRTHTNTHTWTHTYSTTGHFHSGPRQMGEQEQQSSMASHLVFTDKQQIISKSQLPCAVSFLQQPASISLHSARPPIPSSLPWQVPHLSATNSEQIEGRLVCVRGLISVDCLCRWPGLVMIEETHSSCRRLASLDTAIEVALPWKNRDVVVAVLLLFQRR